MRVSCDFVIRLLAGRGYPSVSHGILDGHLLNLESCRAYQPETKLAPGVLYVAQPDALAKRIHVPDASVLLVAGELPQGVRVKGPYATVGEAGFLELLNAVLEVFQAFDNLDASLREASEQGYGVQRFVDIATPFFGNELIIMNSNFKVAAHSYETMKLLEVSGIEPLPDSSFVPLEVASFFQNDAIYKDVETARTPFYYDPSVFSVRVYCINIVVQNEYASRLVLAETSKPIEPCEEELLAYFATYVQEYYERALSEKRPEFDMVALLFKDILDGAPVSAERVGRVIAHRGWSADDALVCACIQPAGYESRVRTLPYFSHVISEEFPETCAVEHGGYIALLVNLAPDGGDPEAFFGRLALMQREGNLRIGQSPLFHGIAEARGRFAQARVALETAATEQLLQWRNTFTSMRLAYVREAVALDIDTELLVAEEIGKLAQHDLTHGTDYVRTLRTYLACGMNALKTASELYVHRATMVYRLKRLREIAGIDFDDADQVLYLQLSFRLFFPASE